jgi:hypothetical protein
MISMVWARFDFAETGGIVRREALYFLAAAAETGAVVCDVQDVRPLCRLQSETFKPALFFGCPVERGVEVAQDEAIQREIDDPLSAEV